VRELIVFADPLGNRLEAFHGAEVASDPFVPGRALSGFRTGPLGLGHVVLNVETSETIQRLLPFYRDLLGFRLTDYYSHPFEAYFLHANPRHHSLAFIRTGRNAVHHLMMEVMSFDDMGQGYDIALGENRVATTLGRHTSDFITSFYSFTPSGFMVEYGWGARSIDPDAWQAAERKEGPSLWGHDRTWLPSEQQAAARTLRRENAEKGLRRPVQVMDGNYHVMAGVCPWWDSMRDPRYE
jgi:2,3-dihydroxybiphenyl 1,2-dioxygenase